MGYGSSEILNFNRQPDFSFYSGSSGSKVEPVINDGRIVDIVITNPGNGYICPPNLVITGPGRFARLTPIITNGRLTEVKIINSGAEYVPGQTQIEVQGPGNNATVEFDINEWNVNLFRRNLDLITEDDGFVEENISGDSLQYCHVYPPRILRETLMFF